MSMCKKEQSESGANGKSARLTCSSETFRWRQTVSEFNLAFALEFFGFKSLISYPIRRLFQPSIFFVSQMLAKAIKWVLEKETIEEIYRRVKPTMNSPLHDKGSAVSASRYRSVETG